MNLGCPALHCDEPVDVLPPGGRAAQAAGRCRSCAPDRFKCMAMVGPQRSVDLSVSGSLHASPGDSGDQARSAGHRISDHERRRSTRLLAVNWLRPLSVINARLASTGIVRSLGCARGGFAPVEYLPISRHDSASGRFSFHLSAVAPEVHLQVQRRHLT